MVADNQVRYAVSVTIAIKTPECHTSSHRPWPRHQYLKQRLINYWHANQCIVSQLLVPDYCVQLLKFKSYLFAYF
jgi:hypothetical protein